jgi:hypothetical protein
VAATADRTTPTRHPEAARLVVSYPVAADAVIYKGTLVALVAGYATPAADASGAIVVGVAEEARDNTDGEDGDIRVLVGSGNAYRFAGSSIVAADVGKTAYVSDDQTVQDAAGTHGIVAGVIEELESANVVWVYVPPTNALALTGAQAGALAPASVAVIQHAITAGDITAGTYDMGFPFAVTAFSATYRSATGVPLDGVTDGAAIVAGDVQISLGGGSAPALIATDIVAVVATA